MHSTKNGPHLYAVAAVVGHSDRQGLLDDRIQQGQEDLCSYLRRREGEGSSAQLCSTLLNSAQRLCFVWAATLPYIAERDMTSTLWLPSILIEAAVEGGGMRDCPCTK